MYRNYLEAAIVKYVKGGINLNFNKVFFIFIMVFTLIMTGCSNEIDNEKQIIKVQKRVGIENKFEDFKEISKHEKVLKAQEILSKADWENTKVSMSGPPDYQFVFLFTDPSIIQEKIDSYKFWISPNKDKLEVIDNENRYTQLTKEQSDILFEIITGSKMNP